MNYQQIKETALRYADRSDIDVIDRIDDFLAIVEARINSTIRIGNQSKRAAILVNTVTSYLGLPTDFLAMRDIQLSSDAFNSDPKTMAYFSPEQMNKLRDQEGTTLAYTIIADQLQVYPMIDGSILEIVYYTRVPALTLTNPDTWLSAVAPNVYVFGLLVEINAFVKDATASELWDKRFLSELDNIKYMDQLDRWSGTALQIRIEV